MPTQKIENSRAVFSGLDKITGRTISFDAAIGETVQFGALQVTARVCYTRPPTEATNTDAFVQVDEVTLQGEVKRIFSGLDVRRQSRPACRRASDLRRLADRLRLPMKVAEPAAPPACRCAGAGRASAANSASGRPRASSSRHRRSLLEVAAAPATAARLIFHASCASATLPETGRSSRQRAKICLADQRRIEQLVVRGPRHLDGAESAQMLGDELGIEQAVMSGFEPRHQMHERDLGGITLAMKHALAEKRASQADAVKPAERASRLRKPRRCGSRRARRACGRGCGSGH